MINFPDNPTVSQIFQSGGVDWMWDGEKWIAATPSSTGNIVTTVAGKTGNVILYHTDITDWTAGVVAASPINSDSPADGRGYGRQNHQWTQVVMSDGDTIDGGNF